ncbi:MAG: HNH endonuclease [Bifidobacteriaceae bacterium]|nr:HNH endonuclease [Bifidobacteriaceae bacterium]
MTLDDTRIKDDPAEVLATLEAGPKDASCLARLENLVATQALAPAQLATAQGLFAQIASYCQGRAADLAQRAVGAAANVAERHSMVQQVALAGGMSANEAWKMVDLGQARAKLPSLKAAMDAGAISAAKAAVVVNEIKDLTPDKAARATNLVLPQIEQGSTREAKAVARRVAAQVDQQADQRRILQAPKLRRVVVEADRDGMSWFKALLRTEHAQAMKAELVSRCRSWHGQALPAAGQTVEGHADASGNDAAELPGDGLTRAQREADLLVSLVLKPPAAPAGNGDCKPRNQTAGLAAVRTIVTCTPDQWVAAARHRRAEEKLGEQGANGQSASGKEPKGKQRQGHQPGARQQQSQESECHKLPDWMQSATRLQSAVVHPTSGRLITLSPTATSPRQAVDSIERLMEKQEGPPPGPTRSHPEVEEPPPSQPPDADDLSWLPLPPIEPDWDLDDPATWMSERLATNARVPSDMLKLVVRLRDQTCRFPGCGVPAFECELDHVAPFRPWAPANQQTVASNLQALCQAHHLAKHDRDRRGDLLWHVRRDPATGATIWHAPNGKAHVVPAAPVDTANRFDLKG